jgi:hypothetical protein
MLALGSNVVSIRKLLDDLDVGREARAGKNTLEEIVAEESIVRYAPGERRLEGIDVIDAFTSVGTLAEQVLIDVRDRRRIRIYAGGTRRDPLIGGPLASER